MSHAPERLLDGIAKDYNKEAQQYLRRFLASLHLEGAFGVPLYRARFGRFEIEAMWLSGGYGSQQWGCELRWYCERDEHVLRIKQVIDKHQVALFLQEPEKTCWECREKHGPEEVRA